MALFKRPARETPSAEPVETEAATVPNTAEAGADAAGPATADAAASTESVPHVNISVSTYGKPPVPQRPAETVSESPQVPQLEGMPANLALQSALKDVPAQPEPMHVIGAMRQALQGHVYLRVSGNAQELMAQNKPLNLAISTIGDKRYLLAYTGAEALRDSVGADGDRETSAIAQPVTAVFDNVLQAGHDGIILDHATEGARIILPVALIRKAVDEADPQHTVKTLLSRQRTDETAGAVVEALTRVKMWVAGRQTEAGMGMAEVHTATGERRLELYSHPLEVFAMGRDDRPLPLTPEHLAAVLVAQPALVGVVIDSAGPWIEISREQLAPVIALAEK